MVLDNFDRETYEQENRLLLLENPHLTRETLLEFRVNRLVPWSNFRKNVGSLPV